MNTTVSENTDHGEVMFDVSQKLLNNRILFIYDELNDQLAADITATLLVKDTENNDKITIFINSGGGDIRNAFMITDMMSIVSSSIETVCIGSATDEAVLILASGSPGMRFATKNSVISVSQLSHDYIMSSNLTDAKKCLDLSKLDNKRMMEIIAKNTGKTLKQVMKDFERQVFMTAQDAVNYNLIDKVVSPSKR